MNILLQLMDFAMKIISENIFIIHIDIVITIVHELLFHSNLTVNLDIDNTLFCQITIA